MRMILSGCFILFLFIAGVHGQAWRKFPTKKPTASPTHRPTFSPETQPPSGQPSSMPSLTPNAFPTSFPSSQPTGQPSTMPSSLPSAAPSISQAPTIEFTAFPTTVPSSKPSSTPTQGAGRPTSIPTGKPTPQPSVVPSSQPSGEPSTIPSSKPSSVPSVVPTGQPSGVPTQVPHSDTPTSVPTTSRPTNINPTGQPTSQPTDDTNAPTSAPSSVPSGEPSSIPTCAPVGQAAPTSVPTSQPSAQPTSVPSTSVPTSPPSRAKYSGIDVDSGSVVIDTKDTDFCQPLHIKVFFKFAIPIDTPVVLSIIAPGLTSGPCYGRANGPHKTVGEVISDGNADYFLEYNEGAYQNSFAASQFVMRTRLGVGQQLDDSTTYSVTFDRENGFKFYCDQLKDWTMKLRGFGETSAFTMSTKLSLSSSIDETKCFWRKATMVMDRATPQFPTSIKITMTAGWALATGTKITIAMPYFSNYQSYPLNHRLPQGQDGSLIAGANDNSLTLTYTTNSSWTGAWIEGSVSDKFKDSKLELTTNGPILSHQNFVVEVPVYPNAISPVCGRPASSSDFTFAVDSSTFDLAATTFDYVSPIGTGCSSQNDCNGNGACDFCTSQCTCFDGYGSAADKLTTDFDTFASDCSTRRCPLGVSGGNIASANTSMHSMRECSNNGLCNRETGTCSCFEGYTGAACSRRQCPGTPFCSARGSCLPMKHLAKEGDLRPILSDTTTVSYTAQRHDVASSWDADVQMGCVCDSTWPVGYGAGETQLAEFFGPACELRRCPSGDDPSTTGFVETNCAGKRQRDDGVHVLQSGLVGAEGNLCHIDCSNRGLCDHTTGTCACFEGYTGANCGFLNTDAYANGFSKSSGTVSTAEAVRAHWRNILGYTMDRS